MTKSTHHTPLRNTTMRASSMGRYRILNSTPGVSPAKSEISPVKFSRANHNPKPILITYELQEDDVLFNISSQRPATNLSKKQQGDHVTAYALFLTMVYNAIEDDEMDEVISKLENIFAVLLPNKINLSNDIEKFRQEQLLSRDKRKKLTAAIRAAEVLESKKDEIKQLMQDLSNQPSFMYLMSNPLFAQVFDYQKDTQQLISIFAHIPPDEVKSTLLRGQTTHKADIISKMATTIIENLNLEKDMCFPRKGKLDRTQGSKVRVAIYVLSVTDKILRINQIENGNDKSKAILDFCQKLLEPKSKLTSGILGIDDDFKNSTEFKNYKKTQNKDDANKLFEYLNNKFLSSNSTLSEKISNAVSDLFDFERQNHGKGPASGVKHSLFKICARHLVIMFNAFSFIAGNKELREKVVDGFLNLVLENHGWNQFKIPKNRFNKDTNLNIKTLREGVEKYCKIGDEGQIAMCFSGLKNPSLESPLKNSTLRSAHAEQICSNIENEITLQ